MAYVGNPIDTQNTFHSLVGKRFNGAGSTTAFTLDVAPGSVLDIEVFVGNVRQDPNSAYTLSGTTLTLPAVTDTIAGIAATQTLTNKSIDSDNNTITNIVNADIKSSAAIADSKLATISTAGKVDIGALEIDGATDIGADLADADLIIVDDGAGGTERKAALSRMKTYIGDPTALAIALG